MCVYLPVPDVDEKELQLIHVHVHTGRTYTVKEGYCEGKFTVKFSAGRT